MVHCRGSGPSFAALAVLRDVDGGAHGLLEYDRTGFGTFIFEFDAFIIGAWFAHMDVARVSVGSWLFGTSVATTSISTSWPDRRWRHGKSKLC